MLRFIILSLLLFALPLQAAIESYEFETVQMEADYNKLIHELRCLVCQNQNLSGSNADLAKDLRKQTYDMLSQGKTSDQVVEYMTDRYGDFVLYRPRLKTDTLLLWFGPFALLALVLWLVIRAMRKKQDLAPPKDDALLRAKQLLSDNQEKS
jgi:cytochrome c-type biogenesis protein CcmH